MSSSCFPGQVHTNEFKEYLMMRLQYVTYDYWSQEFTNQISTVRNLSGLRKKSLNRQKKNNICETALREICGHRIKNSTSCRNKYNAFQFLKDVVETQITNNYKSHTMYDSKK